MSAHDWVVPFDPDDEVDASVASVGGKAANLLELRGAGFAVPDGFVVPADAYREFVELAGIAEELAAAVDVDTDDQEAAEAAAKQARRLVREAPMPPEIAADIEAAYERAGEPPVAVRSSAVAEDRPEASFAGQQETYLGVRGGGDVVEQVQACWASLFTPRAITYRADAGYADETAIAVVVQEMVAAEKSGVLFTADPTTGAAELTVEAAWGLGEGVVSGEVTPDTYVLDRETGDLRSANVATKERMYVPGEQSATVEPVPEGRREARVLDDAELAALLDVGERIEAHYGEPQDVEWAMDRGEVLVLQSRPITTIDEDAVATERAATDGALSGLGASPGVAEGVVCFDPVEAAKRAANDESVVLVRTMTSPSDLHGMKAAAGVLTSRGGRTCHAAIVARELDKPAVVGCEALTVDEDAGHLEVGGRTVERGDRVRIDGDAGTVVFD